jgi:hypothetical protein
MPVSVGGSASSSPRERAPPDVHRHLAALRDRLFEPAGRQRTLDRALLELAGELLGDRVLDLLELGEELDETGVAGDGAKGAHEDERGGPLRMVEREPLGDVAAHRMADDDGGLVADDVQERGDVGRLLLEPVAVLGLVRVAVAAGGERVGADVIREVDRHRRVGGV